MKNKMNIKCIYLIGYPNVGKTTFMNKLLEYTKSVVIPPHVTTRPARDDDRGFYKYVTLDEYKKTDFFIESIDSFGRGYGVENFELEKVSNDKYKYVLINTSIKNIPLLKKRLANEQGILCAMLHKFPQIIISNNINKYGQEEIIYRCNENIIEQSIIKKEMNFLNSQSCYFIDEFNSIDEMVFDFIINNLAAQMNHGFSKCVYKFDDYIYKVHRFGYKIDMMKLYIKKLDYCSLGYNNHRFIYLNKKEKWVEIYKETKGKEFDGYNKEIFNKIIDFLDLIDNDFTTNNIVDENIFSYCDSILSNKKCFKGKLYINDVIKTYQYCKQKYVGEKFTLSHGDLHPENIIIDANNNFKFVDWDEVMYTPLTFDKTVFIFRSLIYTDSLYKINKYIEKYIIKKDILLLYVCKVIFQKIKYYDINSYNENDSLKTWMEYYYLIKNEAMDYDKERKNINYFET